MSDFNQGLFEYTNFKIDVGIDESLLRYSGMDSAANLQVYSNELLKEMGSKLPAYVEKSPIKEPNPEDLLRRVFAEEKASEVRDLMEHYIKHYRKNVRQEKHLLEETKRLEEQIAIQLTWLKNSMLADGHMSDRALKHWTNGAAFHAQMLIHIARLKKKEGGSDFENAKNNACNMIDTYNQDLFHLIEKYKTHKTSELVETTNKHVALHSI
ncbi:hypothetical protein SRHO_G00241910 [Serrasalmus rhombeus]